MALPTSRTLFKNYCLRALGAPVIQINVADEQIEDRVDEALSLFFLYHMDAVERVFLSHTFTASDITNGYITLATPVMSVLNVYYPESGLSTNNWASGVWQYQSEVFADMGFTSTGRTIGLQDYVIRMSNLSLVSDVLGNYPRIQHVMHANRLYIDDNWAQFSEGSKILMECYIALDPETHESIWSDKWLLEYGTALIGRQWGSVLQKFASVELGAGLVLNGDNIYNQYNERVKELEEELDSRYTYPLDFFMA